MGVVYDGVEYSPKDLRRIKKEHPQFFQEIMSGSMSEAERKN